MLLCRLCKAVIRPQAGIESRHQLKGKLLRNTRDYYSAMELAGLKLFALLAGLNHF
ncbi:hypothetical protein FOXYSP1_19663 [Fusarium oxysporum f. sp. phaseoli]